MEVEFISGYNFVVISGYRRVHS